MVHWLSESFGKSNGHPKQSKQITAATATAKQQLNNMKRQLSRKQEELSSDVGNGIDAAKRRQSEVWEGLAEV